MRIWYKSPGFWLGLIFLAFAVAGGLMSQQQISGGGGGGGPATQSGVWTVQPGNTANTTAWKVDGSGATQPVSGTFWQATQPVSGTVTINAIPAGAALIGFIKQRPTGCTAAGTSDVVHDTVGVATGAGTSVSAVTGCILECFVNNITNSAVTLRLADKTGTPIIWVGGNSDFSIPANSNLGCGGNNGMLISGISFASGITAIAGTTAALNLHLVTRE
jgi:hypothetical protein